MFTTALQHLFNGLVIGCSYALIAVGLTMIFGIMNIANFAHGEFYMLGGFFAYYFVTTLGLDFFLAVALAIAAVMAVGVLLERAIFRQLRAKPIMATALVTIGISILLEHLALLLWGPRPKSIPHPFSPSPVRLGPLYTTQVRLFATVLTAGLIVAVHLLIRKSRLGKALRATFQGQEAAALVGIPINRIYSLAFTLGSGLAAAGGSLLGAIFLVHPTMGAAATLKAFVVVIVGGMGSFIGSILSGLLLGLAESFGAGYVSSGYKDAIGFIMVILVLMFRPTGLFRRP